MAQRKAKTRVNSRPRGTMPGELKTVTISDACGKCFGAGKVGPKSKRETCDECKGKKRFPLPGLFEFGFARRAEFIEAKACLSETKGRKAAALDILMKAAGIKAGDLEEHSGTIVVDGPAAREMHLADAEAARAQRGIVELVLRGWSGIEGVEDRHPSKKEGARDYEPLSEDEMDLMDALNMLEPLADRVEEHYELSEAERGKS